MSKNTADARKFDVRLIQRNIKNRFISPSDVAEHLSGLPDVASKATTLGEVEDRRVAKLGDQSGPAPAQ